MTPSNTAATILLNVQNLNAWYGAAQVLFNAQLHVQHGEVVALMGRNGAGKSSTLKAIMGLMPRRSGSVLFAGHDISDTEPYQAARLGLGYVPEDRRIFTDLTVMENLEVGRQPPRRWPDGSQAPGWSTERLFSLLQAKDAPAIEAAATSIDIPVRKPDDAMFDAALEHGVRIGMLATFAPAVASMESAFLAKSRAGGGQATLETICIPEAMAAARAGDHVLIMSNGGFGGIHEKLLKQLGAH